MDRQDPARHDPVCESRVVVLRVNLSVPTVDEQQADWGLPPCRHAGRSADHGCHLFVQTGERDGPGEVLDLAHVVAGADDRWASALADADQVLMIETGAPASVHAARVDVDRALDALIENASRYTPAGSSITVRHQGSSIEVLDTGPGLSHEDLANVFDRFTRGGVGRRSGPGTGLGLPIARELIGRWGGEVTLENRAEGGAVARLTFPAYSAEPRGLVMP